MGDVAVLIPYFNPVGYRSHRRKLSESLQAFCQAGLADDVFLVGAGAWRPSWANVAFWDEEDSFLWHKERLVNLGARALPDSYTHVVWADSDVIVDSDWGPAVKAAFKQAPVVQCFNTAIFRSPAGLASEVRVSALRPGPKAALGGCWGAERSLFSGGPGLFDMALVGGGDAVFATELLGENLFPSVPWLLDHLSLLHESWSEPLIAQLDQWRATVRAWMYGKKAVAAETTVEVLGHGPASERRYIERQALLARIEPSRHLVCDPDRVLRWSAAGLAEVEPAIRNYFEQRREDEDFTGKKRPHSP